MSEHRWVDIGAVSDLDFRPGAAVRVEGRHVAVFPLDGSYFALDNACPHAGAPLCDGTVTDGKVICFLHAWEFDLRTGECDVGPEWNATTYPVREVEGRLQLGLPLS